MVQEYKTVKLKLDGKQSLSIPVDIKKNGKYITEDVDIVVRGFLKFDDSADTDTTLYESESYQRQSANTLSDKVVVHPVLFVSDRIRVTGGRGIITLLPRSEDILEETQTVQSRAGSDITDEDIVNQGGISSDEQITEPDKEPSTIIIETGKIRTPYKISLEVTVIPLNEGGLYTQTVDRGTNPTVDESTSDSSLFSKHKTRISSNLIIECFAEDDWIPSTNKILGTNDDNYETFTAELEDLKNSTPQGSSLLYDSLVTTADLLSDNSLDGTKKVIYTFTDNETNNSIATSSNVVNEINNIDGRRKTPTMISNMNILDNPTLSTRANASDTRDINKISFETGGQAVTVTSSDYLSEVTGIFFSEAVGALGYGTYEFIVPLSEESAINSIVAYFSLPISNANASWEIETSTDGYNYTAINKTYDADESVSYSDLIAKYIKFKITLISGFHIVEDEYASRPASPSLTQVAIVYNQANVVYLYLNEEEEDLLPYHASIAVDQNEISGNEVEVGLSKSDSGSWADYYTSSQPTVNQNGKIVVPIRFSTDTAEFPQEPLKKVDNHTLKTEYGSFDPKDASVIIYNKDDEIIASDRYKLYPRDGVIVLAEAVDSDYADGDYKIGILNGNEYKIGLKLSNKSESESLVLYGISYMYSQEKNLLPPVSKSPPVSSNVVIVNEIPDKYDIIEVSYTYTDTNFDAESGTRIFWYLNGVLQSYMNNLTKFNDIADPNDPFYSRTGTEFPTDSDLNGDDIETYLKKNDISFLKAGDRIYYEVQVSDGELYDVRRKSTEVEILSAEPILNKQIFIKGIDENGSIIDRVSTSTSVKIHPPLSEVITVDGENTTEIKWFCNDLEFKTSTYGEVSASGIGADEIGLNELGSGEFTGYALRIGNNLIVEVTPVSDGRVGKKIVSSDVAVANSLPVVYDVKFASDKHDDNSPLVLLFSFFDYDIDALGFGEDTTLQSNKTTVSWYRKNPGESSFTEVYRYNDQSNGLAETFVDPFYSGKISTNLDTGVSQISSVGVFVGQTWMASITPNDTLNDGETVYSKEVVISASGN